MALVTMKEILLPARKEKRAVGAFNIANYETARAVIQAAEAEKSPVALHLDHGDNVGQVKDALAWGYTSVMYDGSRLPFEENVRITETDVRDCQGYIIQLKGYRT